ncbi:ABC transporter substrate-binding protein [Paenibacillus marinisediminis]
MKKKLLMVLSLVLAFSLVLSACGGGETADPGKTPDTTSAPKTDDTKKEDTKKEEEKKPELVTEGLIPAADKSLNPAPAASRTDTAIFGITDPSGVFNPLWAESSYDVYIVNTIFGGLIKVKADGTYEPDMADYTVSDDSKVITFKLKDGVKFSDGSPVTAEDIAFTTTLMYDPDYDGPSDVMQYAPLVGAKEYKEGNAESISGIKVIDEKTIEFTLAEVKVLALSTLGDGPIPKSVYGKDYKKGNLDTVRNLFQKPVGAGPYKLVEYLPGQEVRLTANEHYYKGVPPIKNVIFKTTTDETKLQLLQTGETDLTDGTVSQDQLDEIAAFGFADTWLNPTNGYGYVAFNNKDPKFTDKKVRQALTIGLNRQEIVDAVYQGYADVINIPQSKVSWSYTNEVNQYEFDTEKAKAMLDEAGWKVGADGIREKDGVKFNIKFTASTPNAVNEALIPVATKNYKDLGINFVADQMDFNALLDKFNKGDYEMVFLAAQMTPDPQSGEGTFRTGGAQNKNNYSNPQVDELWTKAGSTLNMDERKEYFKQIYQLINEDAPMIFMYQRRDLFAINARLQGFDISPYKNFVKSVDTIKIQ